MSLPYIFGEIRRRAERDKWAESYSLEVRLRSGTTITHEFVVAHQGFLELADTTRPEGFQAVFVPFEAIESVRPIWR